MPLIQIEQDSRDVLEGARRKITEMAVDMRGEPGNMEKQNTYVMYTLGYLSALMVYELISNETYSQLMNELDQESDRVWCEDDDAVRNGQIQ